jgi:putative peptidoglycan lipid II flippase
MGTRMGLATILLSVSFLLSRVLGFIREAAVAYLHGATVATDAYYAAFTLPDLMNYFLAGGTLSITFIPLFSSYISRDDEAGGWELFSNVATTMGVVLLVFIVALEVTAPTFVPLLNPGFVPEQADLAVWMTRIVIPAQLAFYIGGLLQATLFVRETFWPTAVAPLVYNLCIILGGVFLEPIFGIAGFSVGVLAGAFLGPLAIPLWAARHDVRFRPHIDISDADFQKFIRLTIPLMVGVSLLTVDEWLLRYFGSHVDGAITWLNNSRKLMLVIFAIIGQAAGLAALPYLTRLYHEDRFKEMGAMLATSLRRVIFLSLVGMAGLIVAAEPMVFLVFRRGAFTAADASQTALLLTVFSLGLLGWSVQSMAARGFYARKNTLIPMLVGTGVVAVILPVYWWLFEQYGPIGLATASAIGITLNAGATVIVYRLKAGELPLAPLGRGALRGAVYAVVCAASAWGARRWMEQLWSPSFDVWYEVSGLLAAMAVGFFGAAGLLAVVYRPPEVDTVLARLQDKLRATTSAEEEAP